MLFISDNTTSTFARRVGAKDKQPRKHTLRNSLVRVGGLALAGGLGYLTLKKRNKLPTNNIVININKKLENTAKVKQRLNLIKQELSSTGSVYRTALAERVGVKPTTLSSYLIRDNQKVYVKDAIKNLKQKSAYLHQGNNNTINFSRRKGSKDKQLRQKRTIGGTIVRTGVGAAGGAALTTAGIGLSTLYLRKQGGEKAVAALNALRKHRKTAIIGGAALGGVVGGTTSSEQLQEGRRNLTAANRTSQELRGYLTLGRRYGIL